jgi:hypothetical protein
LYAHPVLPDEPLRWWIFGPHDVIISELPDTKHASIIIFNLAFILG